MIITIGLLIIITAIIAILILIIIVIKGTVELDAVVRKAPADDLLVRDLPDQVGDAEGLEAVAGAAPPVHHHAHDLHHHGDPHRRGKPSLAIPSSLRAPPDLLTHLRHDPLLDDAELRQARPHEHGQNGPGVDGRAGDRARQRPRRPRVPQLLDADLVVAAAVAVAEHALLLVVELDDELLFGGVVVVNAPGLVVVLAARDDLARSHCVVDSVELVAIHLCPRHCRRFVQCY